MTPAPKLADAILAENAELRERIAEQYRTIARLQVENTRLLRALNFSRAIGRIEGRRA